MNDMHSAVNTCMDQLRQMDFDKIQKLRIEIQLIRVKRLMLALDWKFDALTLAKTEVLTFHTQFSELCSSGGSMETTENLLLLSKRLVEDISAMVRALDKGRGI